MGRLRDFFFTKATSVSSSPGPMRGPWNPVLAAEIEKSLGGGGSRSQMPQWAIAGDVERNGLYEPMWDPRVLKIWYFNNWMLQAAINKVVEMSTKNGWSLEPKFAYHCDECDIDYDELPEQPKAEKPDQTPTDQPTRPTKSTSEADEEKQDTEETQNGDEP